MMRAVLAVALAALFSTSVLGQEGAPAAPQPRHALARDWHLLWTQDGRSSTLRIETAVLSAAGVTQLRGSLQHDEAICPVEGAVVDKATITYLDGIEANSLTILALVTMIAACPAYEMRLDLLGLQEGAILMSGRAILMKRDNTYEILPIAMSPVN
jgi:hypothetical protein